MQPALIIILLFICGFNALSPEVILSTAQNILLNPGPAVGIPYQDIPGPSKDDRVCVVGAGPSGVHMAMRLKKLGYQDVVIFEKSNRVGGKSYDVKYRGVYYPMGTMASRPASVAFPANFDFDHLEIEEEHRARELRQQAQDEPRHIF